MVVDPIHGKEIANATLTMDANDDTHAQKIAQAMFIGLNLDVQEIEEVPQGKGCTHSWVGPSEDFDRIYCEFCGADGDA
jgi:hypothetical protein